MLGCGCCGYSVVNVNVWGLEYYSGEVVVGT